MALEGPRVVYTRKEDEVGDVLSRALSVARELESLLEKTANGAALRAGNSTRIVRAMAASMIDELEALVRGTRKSGGVS